MEENGEKEKKDKNKNGGGRTGDYFSLKIL